MDLRIMNHPKYLATLVTQNVDDSCKNTIEIINDVFEDIAPVKQIKINQNKTKISNDIKEVIKQRDKAYKNLKANKTLENKVEFKNLKYTVQKMIKEE